MIAQTDKMSIVKLFYAVCNKKSRPLSFFESKRTAVYE